MREEKLIDKEEKEGEEISETVCRQNLTTSTDILVVQCCILYSVEGNFKISQSFKIFGPH